MYVCVCVYLRCVCACSVVRKKGPSEKMAEESSLLHHLFSLIYYPAWITHTNVLHSPLPVLLHCCAKDAKEKSKDAFNAVKDLIAGTRKDTQNNREIKRERGGETKREKIEREKRRGKHIR